MSISRPNPTPEEVMAAEEALKAAFSDFLATVHGQRPLDVLAYSFQARVLSPEARPQTATSYGGSFAEEDVLGALDYHRTIIKYRINDQLDEMTYGGDDSGEQP